MLTMLYWPPPSQKDFVCVCRCVCMLISRHLSMRASFDSSHTDVIETLSRQSQILCLSLSGWWLEPRWQTRPLVRRFNLQEPFTAATSPLSPAPATPCTPVCFCVCLCAVNFLPAFEDCSSVFFSEKKMMSFIETFPILQSNAYNSKQHTTHTHTEIQSEHDYVQCYNAVR